MIPIRKYCEVYTAGYLRMEHIYNYIIDCIYAYHYS